MFARANAVGGAAPAKTSTYFLTSAHCFSEVAAAEQLNLVVFFQRASHPCRLFHLFNNSADPLDLALVHCAEGVPVPPTALTEQPYQLQMRVALLGFSQGAHVDASMTYSIKNDTTDAIIYQTALHIRFARLALSQQLPRKFQAASTLVLSTHSAVHERRSLSGSTGYVDVSPEQGMSGGAVVDLQCGLRGISESGGSFVHLNTEVVARVRAALATAH